MNKLFFLFAVLLFVIPSQATILYVDADMSGDSDGYSWSTAYKFLQDALADANSNPDVNEIRLAQGIYKPDADSSAPNATGDRTASFQLINGVSLKGGYPGYGAPDPDLRDIELYRTVLSGDLNGDDVNVPVAADLLDEPTRAENSYHVITCENIDANTCLDGLVIRGANANAGYDAQLHRRGAGISLILSSLTLTDCTFVANSAGNEGGAIYSYRGKLTVTDCAFSQNAVSSRGGAIRMHDTHAALADCKFEKNCSKRSAGGIYSSETCILNMTNCLFTQNVAALTGGAMGYQSGNVILEGCTFSDNVAEQGGAITTTSGTREVPSVRHEIIDCLFINNRSERACGALDIQQETHPCLIRCKFIANTAGTFGGAITVIAYASPTIIDCKFNGNTAGTYAGAVFNSLGNPTFINCIFSGNSAQLSAGTIELNSSTVSLANCTFANNSAPTAKTVSCNNYSHTTVTSSLYAQNCIFSDGGDEICADEEALVDVRFSNVKGGFPGPGNIDADPCFADANGADDIPGTDDDDLRPVIGSPCINAGDPNYTADGKMTMRNEWHSHYVTFLSKKYIDISTIVVKDADKVTPFTEGEDYNIIEDGNSVWLDLLFAANGTPPNFDQSNPYKYFYVDYIFSASAEDVGTDFDGDPRISLGCVDMGAYEYSFSDLIELLDMLAQDIIDLNLGRGIENSLLAKIDAAVEKLLDDNQTNDVAAVNSLRAFINAVAAQSGKKIPPENADDFVATAQQIVDMLSSGKNKGIW